MSTKKSKAEKDLSTEEKIKDAARKLFHQKGFAGTRTRDIADEAGINLALLNYYFRSKEKLFDIIMFETVSGFVLSMATVLNDEDSTLETKVEMLVTNYITFISKEPNIPMFMLNELHKSSGEFLKKLPIKQVLMSSAFIQQHQEAVAQGRIAEPNPLHFLMNLLGLVVFPFVSRILLKGLGGLDEEGFAALMEERKRLIPGWINAMMKVG